MMKHLMAIYVETIWQSLDGKCNMYTHIITYIVVLRNKDVNDFVLYIGCVFGSLNSLSICDLIEIRLL